MNMDYVLKGRIKMKPKQKECTFKVDTQIYYERKRNKYQAIPFAKESFKPLLEPYLEGHKGEALKSAKEEMERALSIMAVLTTFESPMPVARLFQILGLSNKDSADEIAETIENITGLFVDCEMLNNELYIAPRYELGRDVLDKIDEYQYLLPMIVEPDKVGAMNRGSGYLTIKQDSIILNNGHHTEFVCPEILNMFNQIPLTLNTTVVTTISNRWDIEKQTALGTQAFKKYNKDCMDAYAVIYKHGVNKFYLTHKYDTRGRVYSQGYHINYQGNSYNKAVVELYEKELIKDTMYFVLEEYTDVYQNEPMPIYF